ncbi:MAG: tRNA pseudouridine(55) synthase TruB [Steroidobacteraceae bacterium]
MFHGILLLDKPLGLSSSAAVQRVRRHFGRIKAGHTGSLDPLATGMLPICLGEATKVAGYLLEGDKEYEFTARFGARRTTGDLEGEVVEECAVPADLLAALTAALPAFHGEISQIPPMYSALKRDGQPLYKLARQGIEIEREARSVVIHSLLLLAVADAEARLLVRCSKGTYVRTLAEDLARAIGSCAHLAALRRTNVAPFSDNAMVTLEALEAAGPAEVTLLAPDAALAHLAGVQLDEERTLRLRQGQTVGCPDGAAAPGLVRVYAHGGHFLGVGQVGTSEAARLILKPVRLFNDLGPNPT